MNAENLAPPVPTDLPQRTELRIALDFQIITVLYGGGVIGGETDTELPFRPSSIRGHLRFWWRATMGAAFDGHETLLKQESAIWGNQDHSSAVQVRVVRADKGEPVLASKFVKTAEDNRLWSLRYALFPAYEDRAHQGTVYKSGSFKLELCFDQGLANDVDAALRAWIMFGGIGARTRRGAGALYCDKYPGWFHPQYASSPGRAWPTLSGGRAVVGEERRDNWQRSWNTSLDVMRRFRQQRTGQSGRGRSVWPEPDEIRRIRGQYLIDDKKDHEPKDPRHEFRRGELGMPIVFRFKDEGPPPNRDPMSNTLVPEGRERMASPVILKPLAISPNDAVPIMVVLNTPGAPAELSLKQKGEETKAVVRGAGVIDELVQWTIKDWAGKERRL